MPSYSYKNAIDADVTATRADLYTCPTGKTSIMVSLLLANIDGVNTPTIDVELYDSSELTYAHIIKDAPIPVGGSLEIKSKQILESGDKISITASSIGDVSAVGNFMEVT